MWARETRAWRDTIIRRSKGGLTPVEIKKQVIKDGNFTKPNNNFNNENSDTTHTRMLEDPRN